MVHVVSRLTPMVPSPVHRPKVSRPSPTDGSTSTSTSTTAGTSSSGASDFLSLFASKTTSSDTPAPAAPPPPPTAESVFGANPWISNPTGTAPDGSTYSYNPFYFATAQTAATVAQMVGGQVVQSNQLTPTGGGGFQQQQPNYMVQLPDGRMINPGLVASFYTHGYPQSCIDTMVANEVQNT